MTKQRKNSGFTLAEMLIVVAITIILMGVAFIAVQNHQRSMTRLEFDSIAKEIFVAAQNHLTAAQSQRYLQADEAKLGIDHTHTADGSDVDEYLIYKDPDGFSETILEQLLPFGSLDETVRAGGSYVIRYQPSSGRVLEVFYSLQGKSSLLTISGKTLTAAEDDYDGKLKPCAGDDAQAKRRRENYSGGVIGWYGGEEGLERGKELKAPEIKVFNEETLRVEVTDNAGTGSLKLIITGAVSGAQKAFDLSTVDSDVRIEAGKVTGTVNVTLDDITRSGFHFAELSAENGKNFIPGENVIIEAVAFDNSKLTNIAYSGKKTTNSLFADISKQSVTEGGTPITNYTAVIENFRHFENLDKTVSKFEHDKCYEDKDGKIKTINKAEQVKDLLWKGEDAEGAKSFLGVFDGSAQIYAAGEASESTAITKENCLCPVDLDYKLTYDGKSHKVSLVDVEHTAAVGLFGNVSAAGSQIANLELIDFDIKASSGNAGALVGKIEGTESEKSTISNVLAYHTAKTDAYKTASVTASSGDAGGLIGSATNCEVTKCAAALVVSGSANAGGLIGSSTGGEVKASYSGGHTYSGNPNYTGTTAPDPARTPNAVRYYDSENKPIYNVTGGTATGGLIGNAGNTEISSSYSTCSAKATDATGGMAGGFVGTGTGKMTNCYCTGLVSGTIEGAFAGSLSETPSGCQYFEIINERQNVDENDKTKVVPGYHYLTALGENKTSAGITAFDDTAATYETFCGAQTSWKPATPYDGALKTYYLEKYNLQTIGQLLGGDDKLKESESDETVYFVATHYGDWPAPEEFVFN